MKRPRSIPDHLYFPLPPARIDRTLAEAPFLPAVAARYLFDIQRWRDAVVTALGAADPAITHIENLTPRARRRLGALLDTKWDTGIRGWPASSLYGLNPFPATHPPARVDDSMRAVLEVLHWRAAIINYLTDVWDVSGKPELEMGECMAIGAFMRPGWLEGRCVYCLTEFKQDRLDPEVHGCVMASHAGAR